MGEKMNASKIPTIIAIKMGFSKKKDKTIKITKIIVVEIFLKYSSAIFISFYVGNRRIIYLKVIMEKSGSVEKV
jgi:hypothetical protein